MPAQEGPGPAAPPPPASKPAAPPNPPPPSADLRPQLEKWGFLPRAQGGRGTCSVFVVTEALEFALARRTDQPAVLSVEYLDWAADAASGRRADGDFFHRCLAGFERFGICTEARMPYRSEFDPALEPDAAARGAAQALLEEHGKALHVRWIQPLPEKPGLTREHLDAIRRTLAAGWPVAGGSFHSVLFVGYRDPDGEGGDGVLIARDSARAADLEIPYSEALARFGDVFWIEADPLPPGPSGSSGGRADPKEHRR